MIMPEHLTGFLLLHAGFRAEFGRLAAACANPRDDAHEELLEEQLALVLDLLHAHHAHEDAGLWPTLVGRAPQAADRLAELESEHSGLDPLLAAASDRGVPLAERAPTLRRLHELVNEHLDHEELAAVPLMLRCLTLDDVEADRRQAMDDFGRRRAPVIFGWLASSADAELLSRSYADLPAVARLLFRLFWWPAYRRRFTRLYGATLPANALLES
ncbi:hemerythrin domain-containing protein [Pseudofrankia inefficax]|uniref:Hemerythrin HHE cation binding domain protein n=1 Tax=Pseudofrankia inefficax (strain DSM 45817 / CECT 9037 / DDB 130130 / EuI1c) TaxID=298654 RepID=E3J0I1_PSEI1|nr:hemerythrin domain-containing protein [Pseudofrankia inefficax]ADP81610.1 hemerythrin HHE cation binding domain protein [Pseudofrankia inefficax]